MEDAGQQGAATAPASEPESPATPSKPATLAEATQEQRQLTVEELEQPLLQPQARPQFSSRSVAPNEFQIFHGEIALGKRLTPSESAIVLAWAKSIDDSVDSKV